MRAVVLQDGQLTFQSDYQANAARHDWIPVRVLKAGICETDLQLKQGYMGFSGVPGHEFVGIAQAGPFQGKRVVGEINCACGSCDCCQRDLPRHCRNRSVLGILHHDGAFAETVWLPQQNLHVVPEELSADVAVFTEPVAAACRIAEQLHIRDTDDVVILGDGRLGNLCAQVLRRTGCRLTVVGKHPWKLNRLAELGINTVLRSDFSPAADRDIVIDCTGSPSGLEMALQTVRPCGTVVQKTTVAGATQMHTAGIVIDEVTIIGSRCGPFEPALEMLTHGEVLVDTMISAEFPLEDAVAAFAQAERPDTLKVLLHVSDP